MATTTQTVEQLSLKLLVNKETDKVLYAEAGKDFVDVLCSFLTLPLGTIARLIEKKSDMGPTTLGCLNSLYHSVANLKEECFWKKTTKEMLQQPTNSSEHYCRALKLKIDDTEPTKYFKCSESGPCEYNRLSTSTNINCKCRKPFNCSVLMKPLLSDGFVQFGVSFFITDDLIVMPNSIEFTSFGLLQKSGIKSTSSIKEMNVSVTKEKVLDLLKCALFSKSPITDLFLEKTPSLKRSRIFSFDTKNNSDIQFRLKLVTRKSACKILFAQCEQDFTDFLLSFLTYPLGGVARILGGNCSLGSIDSLYKSISDIDGKKYIISPNSQNLLVNPHIAPQFKLTNQVFPVQQHTQYVFYHFIDRNEFFVTDRIANWKTKCRKLELVYNPELPNGIDEGYLKGPRMYVVTDDLVIAPSSLVSTLSLINQTPLDDLMEEDVTIGINECLNILKAVLTSTSVLTDSLSHLLTEVKEEN